MISNITVTLFFLLLFIFARFYVYCSARLFLTRFIFRFVLVCLHESEG
tara:strand:+ start:28583 stop:28726 length:144 start_codon:yes stop_codon:yes gene_type:complete